ncbi:MAG: DNA-formamidopyrimidine glycosylase family protein [Actinomycetota bacterium]
MPEGDTVFRAARMLDGALRGSVLRRTDFRVPAHATADLSGQVVDGVASRGKHLLLRTDAGWTLHTHLKMEGRWHVARARPGGRRPMGAAPHEIRVLLETDDCLALGLRLGIVELLRTSDEPLALGHLGPDLLGPDWDLAAAAARIRAEPGRAIGEALLDQRNLAGIGNLYRNEVLFLSGEHPWTRVADVADLERMLMRVQRMLLLNTRHPEQAITGDTRKGYRWWVMERPGKPCRRCGTPIEFGRQGDPPMARHTYWCPHCQPARPPG